MPYQMDFNSTIDLIIRELDEAREIIDDLKKFRGAPVLQIELAKSKCRNAAEVISLLKESANAAVETEAIITPVPNTIKAETLKAEPQEKEPGRPVVTPAAEEAAPKAFSGHDTFEIEDETNTGPPEIISHRPEKPVAAEKTTAPEKTKVPEKSFKPEKVSEASEKETEREPKKPFVAPIIADTFSHLANRFNEQIGETHGDDFSYSHGRHLSNLSEAIGINDKFYYIREIFDGNYEAYLQALSKLENAQNLAEARLMLMSYRTDKSDNQAVRQLLDLVRRKFTGNE
jgi:hypothetical protein